MQRVVPFALVAMLLAVALPAPLPTAEAASVAPAPGALPLKLVGAAAVHVDGKTYIFGGREASGTTYSSRILSYDHATGEVTHVASFPATANAPKPGRYSGTAALAGGKIYYFGGATLVGVRGLDRENPDRETDVPRASREIFEFDPATGRIRLLLDTLPYPAWGLGSATAAVRGTTNVYLFGGFTFDFSDLPATRRHNDIVRFNAGASEGAPRRVERLADALPYAVQDAAVANLNGRVLIMGGLSDHHVDANPCPTYTFHNSNTGQQETRQTEVCLTRKIVSFDPVTELQYGVVGDLPYRAQFVSAGVVNGRAYIPGALLADGTAANTIVEVTIGSDSLPRARTITPTLPQGGFGQAVSSDGTHVWVFGGRFGEDRDLTDRIVRLDPRATAPWAPRSAAATEVQGVGVRLTWEPPAYNGDAAVTGYRVYRSSPEEPERLVAEVSGLSWEDRTIKAGIEYAWRITAVNVAGESETGSRVSRGAVVTTPGPVASFAAYAGNGEVVLRWLPPANTGGSNITGYRIFRDGTLLTTVSGATHEHVDSAVANGRTYGYSVRAVNSKGDGTPSETIRVEPQPVPPPPGEVHAQAAADEETSSVTLSWIPPPEAVRRFLVYRSTAPGIAGTLVANLTQDETVYVDNLVERGRTYYYSVKTANEVGESVPSSQVAVALVRKPGAPQDVKAIGLPGEVRITWSPPADLGDAPAASLRYFVSRDGRIIKTDIEATGFSDRTTTPGRQSTYTVTALNPLPSDPSAPATAAAMPVQNALPGARLAVLPAFTMAGAPVEIDASQSSDADGTIVSYTFDFGDGTDLVTTQQPTVTHSYVRNGTYTVQVVVRDNRGETGEPATAQVVVGETISGRTDSGLGGLTGDNHGRASTPDDTNRPGSSSGKIPGPGGALVVAALAAVALALARRRAR